MESSVRKYNFVVLCLSISILCFFKLPHCYNYLMTLLADLVYSMLIGWFMCPATKKKVLWARHWVTGVTTGRETILHQSQSSIEINSSYWQPETTNTDTDNRSVTSFKTSPHQLQLSWRRMQSCFNVKLQKCLVDYKTSSDFSSAWRWIINFHFCVNSVLIINSGENLIDAKLRHCSVSITLSAAEN